MSWSGRKGAVGGPDETIDYWGLAPNVLTEILYYPKDRKGNLLDEASFTTPGEALAACYESAAKKWCTQKSKAPSAFEGKSGTPGTKVCVCSN